MALWPMRTFLSTPELAIWMALIAGKVILCLCIFKKRLFQRLPLFSGYVLASTVKSLLLFVIAFLGSYGAYYYTFYITGRIIWILAFLTLLEFVRQVLPSLNLPRKERAAIWLMVSLGIVVTFAARWPLRYVENRVELAGYLVIAVSFIVIARYSRSLGLGWSRLLGGVAFTLGMLYLVEGMTAVTGHYSAAALPARQISQVGNLLAVLAWTIVVVSPWGEYEMTEEDLVKLEQIVGGVETNLRDFVAGGSR
jgi:hypothetical protein